MSSSLPGNPSASFISRNPHLYKAEIKPAKRIRQDSKPLLNKLEEDFLSWLACRRYLTVHSQATRFKISNGHWYKPDFTVFDNSFNQLICYEVKGPHAFRGGFENIKDCATLYRWIKWVLVWKEDGCWKKQIVLP